MYLGNLFRIWIGTARYHWLRLDIICACGLTFPTGHVYVPETEFPSGVELSTVRSIKW
jgi:hypothetical protein